MSYTAYDRKNQYEDSTMEKGLPEPDAFRSSNPYGGRELSLSPRMAHRVHESFGIAPEELKLRESSEVERMGARATAQGDVIRFAPGEYRPDTREGEEILGHELYHLTEQAGGLAPNVPGTDVLFDGGREAAGDRAGATFASGGLQGGMSSELAGAESAPVQGSWKGVARYLRGAGKFAAGAIPGARSIGSIGKAIYKKSKGRKVNKLALAGKIAAGLVPFGRSIGTGATGLYDDYFFGNHRKRELYKQFHKRKNRPGDVEVVDDLGGLDTTNFTPAQKNNILLNMNQLDTDTPADLRSDNDVDDFVNYGYVPSMMPSYGDDEDDTAM